MNSDFTDPVFLKLALQRSLLGNIPANLAGLSAKLDHEAILITAYFFVDPSKEDKACIEDAAGEVIGDFPECYTVQTYYGLLSEVSVGQQSWNFLRAEALS